MSATPAHGSSPPAITVRDLVKSFGEVEAVRGVNFEVATGEVFGFLGPNGAGKTTTMRIITGFLPATTGTVKVDGFDIFEDAHEVRKRTGYLPENPPLYADMTVSSYLEFVGRIKGVPRAALPEAVDRAVQRCGLTEVTRRVLGHLSKGFRQRVGLAQALIHEPHVLILDEPTIGLDPRQIRDIRSLIKELAGERTVILSTHILQEVVQICQKVVIISNGRVVVEDQIENLTREVPLEEVFMRAIGGSAPEEASA